ncbi:MAG: hypothetical protein DUD32_05995 [Lactobacillus sp.]|nr:MAG: hypothetical protein DUD32_05995 [Lactobacillus sp.]
MDKIVFTLEFSDDNAQSRANKKLAQGWLLLHVGTKVIDIVNDQMYYNTAFVVGATKEQYDQYKAEQKSEDEEHDELLGH